MAQQKKKDSFVLQAGILAAAGIIVKIIGLMLKQRRHQKRIARRINLMGQCIRIINIGRNFSMIFPAGNG